MAESRLAGWRLREAATTVARRNRNEGVPPIDSVHGKNGYLCECGDSGCRSLIRATVEQYETVRSEATRFLVAPDHEDPETDVLVSESAGFSMVGKLTAELRSLARFTDPRGWRASPESARG